VVITGERAVPAEYCTHSRQLALQFLLTHLAVALDADVGARAAAAE
jgi:hypothetical protein